MNANLFHENIQLEVTQRAEISAKAAQNSEFVILIIDTV